MTKRSGQSQQLRIIGGRWRGRKFPFAELNGLRPTGDRIRETLFNWLAADIHGARCLDLFAGSGALSLEALSRGAANATMWENQKPACQLLRSHLSQLNEQLGEQEAQVEQADTLTRLQQRNTGPGFDIVFMDPPFAGELWADCAAALENGNWLAENALIYIESPKGQAFTLPKEWRSWRSKNSGQVCYQLYVNSPETG